MNQQTNEFLDYLRIISKYRYLILLTALLFVVAMLVISVNTVPTYQTSFKLLVRAQSANDLADSTTNAEEAYNSILIGNAKIGTYIGMFENRTLALRVIRASQANIDPSSLKNMIVAERVPSSQLIEVTITDTDQTRAHKIARAVNDVFPQMVDEIESKNNVATWAKVIPLEQDIAPASSVVNKTTLRMLNALVLGLVGGIGMAFLISYLNVSIETADEAERLLGVPVIGVIPQTDQETDELFLQAHATTSYAEAFRFLKTTLKYANPDKPVNVFAFASSLGEEGVPVLSMNLAATFARNDVSVLLIDCDLRLPKIHELSRLDGSIGLADVLLGAASLSEATRDTHIDGLHIMPAGSAQTSPAELLESDRMRVVVEEARETMDYVLLAGPPLNHFVDSLALCQLVDSFILVIKASQTPQDIVRNAKDKLALVNAPLNGAVLTNVNLNSTRIRSSLSKYKGRTPSGPQVPETEPADIIRSKS